MQGNILLVGHASGELVLWEFKRTGWEAVKALKDAHTAPVTTAAFLESSSQLAITGDAKGRLVLHNVTAYLSIASIFTGQGFPQSAQNLDCCCACWLTVAHSGVMCCVLWYAVMICNIPCDCISVLTASKPVVNNGCERLALQQHS